MGVTSKFSFDQPPSFKFEIKKKNGFFKSNMAGFEPASSCYKHHGSTTYLPPNSHLFPQLITERDICFEIYNKHVSDRWRNNLTPPYERNNFSINE